MNIIQQYQDHLKNQVGLADSTIAAYITVIQRFERFLLNRPPELRKDLLTVETSDIEAYFAFLYKKDCTQNTRRTYTKYGLKGFYEYLYHNKMIQEEVKFKYANTKPTFKEVAVKKQYLKLSHIEQLRTYLRNHPPVAGSLEDQYYHLEQLTAIELLFETGARRSELVNMRYEDVGDNFISIFTAKTARRTKHNHYRNTPISADLVKQIAATRELYTMTFGKHPDRIITRYRDLTAVSHNIAALGQLAGLDIPIHPHLFRHYRITYFVHLRDNHGSLLLTVSEVAMMMGASVATILQYYDHPDEASADPVTRYQQYVGRRSDVS
jgi:site-specific recombinase XerD